MGRENSSCFKSKIMLLKAIWKCYSALKQVLPYCTCILDRKFGEFLLKFGGVVGDLMVGGRLQPC